MSPAGLAGGVNRLADGYRSLFTIEGATRFTPGQHQGPSTVPAVRYDATANKMVYIGERRTLTR